MIDLLQLLRSRVEPAKIKKVSGAKGGEYHSPCPLCGGTDRFCVFPEQDGGELCQKHGLRGSWACIRGCGKGGDVIGWFTEIEGFSFKEACAELKIPLDSRSEVRRGYRPLRAPFRSRAVVFEPREYALPPEIWRQAATRLATDAHNRVGDYPAVLNYLAKRGLPRGAVDRYGLGYIEGEAKNPANVFRARAAYGLPEKFAPDGRLIRAFRMPRGITIPVWTEAGEVSRVRIRRRDIDRDKSNPRDSKYLLVSQPGEPYSAPLALYPDNVSPDLATWVITEAELDAMAVHYACGGAVGAISILTAKGKPDKIAHAALSRAARILVALDADEDKADGGNPGAEAWVWWKQTYPQARLWPVPDGKDPGEAFALGVDLAEWIFAGSLARRPTNASGLPRTQKNDVQGGNEGKSLKKPAKAKIEGKREAWPIPEDVVDFYSIPLPAGVKHRELVNSQARFPLDDPECLLPCPKTDPPFWWRYHRDCARFKCGGHPECLLSALRSPIFLQALEARKANEAEISS